MKRQDLEHIIRAAGTIADSRRIVVIGSQAILGSWPAPPEQLAASQEADVWPQELPERADLIDGSIGELSPFHEQFGYYAHGVSPQTAVLAPGWEERLVPLCNENTRGITGLCLHPLDLAVSKLAAGREKDIAFVRTMLGAKMIEGRLLEELAARVPAPHAAALKEALRRLLAERTQGQ
jgi:hypothetical protein